MAGSREEWIQQIEAAIEAEHYTEAREILANAERQTGEPFAELARRIDEIERLTRSAQAGDLVARARAEMAEANYEAAVDSLQRARALDPADPELAGFLQRAEKALERQRESVVRSRAIHEIGREIEAQLQNGDLARARQELHDAGVKFGRQPILVALESRLDELENDLRRQQARQGIDRARTRFEAQDWRGALQAAAEVLRLQPGNHIAKELQKQARAHLERREGQKQRQEALETAQDDVERLIAARELGQAAARLREVRESLGHEPVFDQLQQRIDRARSDLQFRQRIEWAERRAKEAERLIQEASSLSLQGEYETAVERLESARELDPSHPDLADLLAAADTALEKQQERRQRSATLATYQQKAGLLLDQVRLDEAEEVLQSAAEELPEARELESLRHRLERMRAAQQGSRQLASAGFRSLESRDLNDPGVVQALREQQVLWGAYPWDQALLFPFRGSGPALFAALVGLGLVVDLTVALGAPAVLALLPVLLAVGWLPILVRSTLAGANEPPEANELMIPEAWTKDGPRLFGFLALLFAPLLLWIYLRQQHGLLGAESGFVGWFLVSILAWVACAFAVLGLGAGGLFGGRFTFRWRHHLQTLWNASLDAHLAFALPFGLLVVVVWVRAVALPELPWLGSPLSRCLEAYGWLTVPHAAGVLARSRTLVLARTYGL